MLQAINDFLGGTTMEKIYWCMALFGTALFVLTAILSLVGNGTDADVDVATDMDVHIDTGYADLQIISIKTLISFVMFMGWGGILFGQTMWGCLGAIALGIAMMVLTAYIVVWMLRLQESGNITDDDFIGQTGDVYMSIPGGTDREGKVQLQMKAGVREVNAISVNPIQTGTPVRIVKKHTEGCFVVEKIEV